MPYIFCLNSQCPKYALWKTVVVVLPSKVTWIKQKYCFGEGQQKMSFCKGVRCCHECNELVNAQFVNSAFENWCVCQLLLFLELSNQLSGITLFFLWGVPSLIPWGISTGVIETAKAWECYIRQEMCYSYRGRTRQYGHDKESKRGRERDREDCSFSYNRWVSMSYTYLVYLIFKSVSLDVSHWTSTRHCMPPSFTCPSTLSCLCSE